ncbi:hypothetical protein [Pusillimonas sp. ANT_WB101]|uniref:hypothetical protein n=1 Tax=Pusillimonas sp. ANT_WB101 TaxID=2597356 RepID=UPI0011F04CDA|nr:hypothetical protein [Pusillimonas sp. ANT_WB101]KAA0910466.1 hypothetical protein FQ179_00790 [Pusillimonas sp. ANT_WB101]
MNKKSNSAEDKHNGIRHLINTGAEIAGGAVGGALGFLAGGPVGAALLGAGGAAAATALRHIGEEASERLLGPREQVRIGGVLAIAASEIRQRLEKGESLRNDDFFEPKGALRSDAEEVAESVLLKSQREPEERKLPYMGNLFAAVAFDSQISAQLAHQITKVAEQLTYRQLCILKLATVKESFSLRADDYRNHGGGFAKELYQVLYECLDLYYRGLINFGGEVAFGPTDVKPGSLTVQGLGVDIFNLMKLASIPESDLTPITAQLK